MGALRASVHAPRLASALLGLAGVSSLALACGEETVPERDPFCDTVLAVTAGEQYGSGLPDKTLALTFDDGPAERTEELSHYLASEGIAATFFINGQYVEGREATIEAQIADGHLLGNHTHTHPFLTQLSSADVVSELEKTDAILGRYVPAEKRFFRPPFGDWNAAVHQSLSASAMNKYTGPVGWDIGDRLTQTTAADWDCWDAPNGTRTVEQCGDLYLREIREKGRGIVLLHDGPPLGENGKTVDMIKLLVPKLKAEGYKFVRVDEVPLETRQIGSGTFEGQLPEPPPPPVDPCRGRARSSAAALASFTVDPDTYACGAPARR